MDVNWTYCSYNFALYANIKTWCCAPETHLMLGQLYPNLKKREKRKSICLESVLWLLSWFCFTSGAGLLAHRCWMAFYSIMGENKEGLKREVVEQSKSCCLDHLIFRRRKQNPNMFEGSWNLAHPNRCQLRPAVLLLVFFGQNFCAYELTTPAWRFTTDIANWSFWEVGHQRIQPSTAWFDHGNILPWKTSYRPQEAHEMFFRDHCFGVSTFPPLSWLFQTWFS